jgi:hypothetical protein
MNPEEIATKILNNWPFEMNYETTVEIVKIAETRKTFGYKFTDEMEEKFGVSCGFASLVAKTIKEQRKLDCGEPRRSSDDARFDRMLRIRDSNGKTTARKWN